MAGALPAAMPDMVQFDDDFANGASSGATTQSTSPDQGPDTESSDTSGGGALGGMSDDLMDTAQGMQPVRSDVLQKRQLLDDAMKRLAESQQFRQPDLNQTIVAMGNATSPYSPWQQAISGYNSGLLQQQNAQQAADQKVAGTNIEAATQKTKFDQQDTGDALKYAQLGEHAGATNATLDERQAEAQLSAPKKSIILIKQANGSQRAYDTVAEKYIDGAGAAGSPASSNQTEVNPTNGLPVGIVPQGTSAPIMSGSYNQYANTTPAALAAAQRGWEKGLKEDTDRATLAQTAINNANQFKSVYMQHPTTGFDAFAQNWPLLNSIDSHYNPSVAEMGSLNKEMVFDGDTPKNMRITQGEVYLLKSARPGLTQGPANINLADAYIAAKQRPIDYANFKTDFMANNGYWNEALGDQMFGQYMKDNPIFPPGATPDTLKKSDYLPNPNRMSVQDYAAKGGFSRFMKNGRNPDGTIVNPVEEPGAPANVSSTQNNQPPTAQPATPAPIAAPTIAQPPQGGAGMTPIPQNMTPMPSASPVAPTTNSIPAQQVAAQNAPKNVQVASPSAPPQIGEVRKGYVFIGGNPADPHSWQRAQ